jgi:hypothetical protein
MNKNLVAVDSFAALRERINWRTKSLNASAHGNVDFQRSFNEPIFAANVNSVIERQLTAPGKYRGFLSFSPTTTHNGSVAARDFYCLRSKQTNRVFLGNSIQRHVSFV